MRELKIESVTAGVGNYARQIYIKDKGGKVVAVFFPWCKQLAYNPNSGYKLVEPYCTKEFWESQGED